MTYMQALQILDQAREGADFDKATINTALELTGDLDHIHFSLADALGIE